MAQLFIHITLVLAFSSLADRYVHGEVSETKDMHFIHSHRNFTPGPDGDSPTAPLNESFATTATNHTKGADKAAEETAAARAEADEKKAAAEKAVAEKAAEETAAAKAEADENKAAAEKAVAEKAAEETAAAKAEADEKKAAAEKAVAEKAAEETAAAKAEAGSHEVCADVMAAAIAKLRVKKTEKELLRLIRDKEFWGECVTRIYKDKNAKKQVGLPRQDLLDEEAIELLEYGTEESNLWGVRRMDFAEGKALKLINVRIVTGSAIGMKETKAEKQHSLLIWWSTDKKQTIRVEWNGGEAKKTTAFGKVKAATRAATANIKWGAKKVMNVSGAARSSRLKITEP